MKIIKVEPINGVMIRQKVTAICEECGKEKIFRASTGDYQVGEQYPNDMCNDCQLKENDRIEHRKYEKFIGKKIKKIDVHDGYVKIFVTGNDVIDFVLPGYE